MKKVLQSFLACAVAGWGLAATDLTRADHASDNDTKWETFGDVEVIKDKSKKKKKGDPWSFALTSDCTSDEPFGVVELMLDEGTLFADLTNLSADYLLLNGAGGGSPRFQIAVDENGDGDADGNVFVYLGTPPNFDDEPSMTWESTGNLIEDEDLRFDSTQFGGPFYGDFEDAQEAVGENAEVVAVALVVDGCWATEDGIQTVIVDNVTVGVAGEEFRLSTRDDLEEVDDDDDDHEGHGHGHSKGRGKGHDGKHKQD